MTTPVRLKFQAEPKDAGLRLDQWLANQQGIESRNQIARLIERALVKVSGVATLKVKASYRLRGDEVVEVEIPPANTSGITPEEISLEILYQDNDLAVINKQAGLVTHPAKTHQGGTLVNALLFHIKDLSDIGGVERPGLVHRLDKDTSGTIVVAKTNKAHQGLAQMFKKHEIHRVYWAIVAGIPKKKNGTIESNLARHPKFRKAFCSQEHGKRAVTHFEVIKSYKNQASLIEVRLETGRTHQIRVHLSEMGHPVLGDKIYGIKRQSQLLTNSKIKQITQNLKRHALHAAELGFEHPRTLAPLKFKTDWPDDLKELLLALNSL
ncbi:MAG: RluA family pseudouridine synthase [Oligoflexia bacterium]|nr:RluA family pseudouridine synthase [Oligoflexia bacterium]